jgi:hypothetical protein
MTVRCGKRKALETEQGAVGNGAERLSMQLAYHMRQALLLHLELFSGLLLLPRRQLLEGIISASQPACLVVVM